MSRACLRANVHEIKDHHSSNIVRPALHCRLPTLTPSCHSIVMSQTQSQCFNQVFFRARICANIHKVKDHHSSNIVRPALHCRLPTLTPSCHSIVMSQTQSQCFNQVFFRARICANIHKVKDHHPSYFVGPALHWTAPNIDSIMSFHCHVTDSNLMLQSNFF